jgi:hypothetical protein|tara:strand:+ start:257 stop:496 length:240 start_codon:yes stop_codon:yes gene_type:complete
MLASFSSRYGAFLFSITHLILVGINGDVHCTTNLHLRISIKPGYVNQALVNPAWESDQRKIGSKSEALGQQIDCGCARD